MRFFVLATLFLVAAVIRATMGLDLFRYKRTFLTDNLKAKWTWWHFNSWLFYRRDRRFTMKHGDTWTPHSTHSILRMKKVEAIFQVLWAGNLPNILVYLLPFVRLNWAWKGTAKASKKWVTFVPLQRKAISTLIIDLAESPTETDFADRRRRQNCCWAS